MIDYIKNRQRLMEEEWKAEEEAELDAEEARVAKIKAEAHRKQLILEQQEDERACRKYTERKEKIAAETAEEDATKLKNQKNNYKIQDKMLLDNLKFKEASRKSEAKAEVVANTARFKQEQMNNKRMSENRKSTLATISTLTSSNNQTLFDVGRAAALAMAYIDGSAAVTKALASAPPPFNFALAAAVGAAVAVQIGQIISAKPPKMADGGMITGGISGMDSVPAMLMPGELVVPTRNFEEVVGAVGGGRDDEVFGGGGGATQIVIGFDGEEASQVLTAKQIENQALGISREEAA